MGKRAKNRGSQRNCRENYGLENGVKCPRGRRGRGTKGVNRFVGKGSVTCSREEGRREGSYVSPLRLSKACPHQWVFQISSTGAK